MTKIEVTGNHNPIGAPCLIDVDEFVPLRFRTYHQPIGAVYLRIGNYSTTLTELIVDPGSRILRGLTLTSFESFDAWPNLGSVASLKGLPILRVDWEKGPRIDVRRDFHVSLRANELLVSWGDMANPSASFVFGKVQFFISESELRGVRFFDLTAGQTSLLAYHARRTA
jgi:hypothetical protein